MDSSVDRLTRYREFCLRCLEIVSVTLAAEVLLLPDVKVTASWRVAPDPRSRSQRSLEQECSGGGTQNGE